MITLGMLFNCGQKDSRQRRVTAEESTNRMFEDGLGWPIPRGLVKPTEKHVGV